MNNNSFISRLQVDPKKGYEKVRQKQEVFKLVNDYPEILDSLPAEKLKIIYGFYEENYKRIKKY